MARPFIGEALAVIRFGLDAKSHRIVVVDEHIRAAQQWGGDSLF